MRHIATLLIAVIALASVSAVTSADPIVEAARKERARQATLKQQREAAKKRRADRGEEPDKPLTAEDLRALRAKYGAGTMSTIGGDPGAPRAAPPAAAADQKDKKGTQEEWAAKTQAARDAVTAAQDALRLANEQINEARRRESAVDDPRARQAATQERLTAEGNLAVLQRQLEAAKAALDNLANDARRAGAPAGWVR